MWTELLLVLGFLAPTTPKTPDLRVENAVVQSLRYCRLSEPPGNDVVAVGVEAAFLNSANRPLALVRPAIAYGGFEVSVTDRRGITRTDFVEVHSDFSDAVAKLRRSEIEVVRATGRYRWSTTVYLTMTPALDYPPPDEIGDGLADLTVFVSPFAWPSDAEATVDKLLPKGTRLVSRDLLQLHLQFEISRPVQMPFCEPGSRR